MGDAAVAILESVALGWVAGERIGSPAESTVGAGALAGVCATPSRQWLLYIRHSWVFGRDARLSHPMAALRLRAI